MAADLLGVADDTRGAEISEDLCFSLSNLFIQPFCEETDSRNEYKTQVRDFTKTGNFIYLKLNSIYLITTSTNLM